VAPPGAGHSTVTVGHELLLLLLLRFMLRACVPPLQLSNQRTGFNEICAL
jgi:hypothetical protein